jgi:hypothetical protein
MGLKARLQVTLQMLVLARFEERGVELTFSQGYELLNAAADHAYDLAQIHGRTPPYLVLLAKASWIYEDISETKDE